MIVDTSAGQLHAAASKFFKEEEEEEEEERERLSCDPF
jgi:hypothetical protein